jgi:hypothetical protein
MVDGESGPNLFGGEQSERPAGHFVLVNTSIASELF